MRGMWAMGILIAAVWAPPLAAISMTGVSDGGAAGSSPSPELAPPSAELGLTLDNVPAVALASVNHEALFAEDEANAAEIPYKILRVGVGRALSVWHDDGQWYDFEISQGDQDGDGEEEKQRASLWVADVVSSDAVGLRLHFPALSLPLGGRVAVYAPADDRPADVQIFENALQDGDFWTGTVPGERARVEIYYPDGRPEPQDTPVVDDLQHLYRDSASNDGGFSTLAAGNCHNDVTCHSAWANVAKAVARITFIKNGSTFLCSGQLLNSLNSDLTPYFLTANHCISSNTVAQTAEFFWRYQTSTCNGTPPSLSSVPKSRVATLLSTGSSADYTLLMVEGGLPSDLFWVGWTTDSIPDNTASTAIHHPSGDYKRISFGNRSGGPTCGPSQGHKVSWTDGPTEGGSSGSGIFRNSDQRLYGQLSCGSSACGNETSDTYGSFASAHSSISSFLNGGSDDPSEDNDTCSNARTAQDDTTYSSRIVKSTDQDWYKIVVPFGSTLTVTLTFTHANGNINARVFGTCGGSILASASGTTDTETLTYTNLDVNTILSAPTLKWQVFLASDTRNSYNMAVSVSP